MLEKILVLLVVAIVALMFFGNRLPQVLGDLGKGVRAFKDGMGEGGAQPTKKGKPGVVKAKTRARPAKLKK